MIDNQISACAMRLEINGSLIFAHSSNERRSNPT